ncbi:MAG: hypothetical protein U1E27_13510 [Kiritimatiellia bacterium]|nr:hypothetical protein [Kiritimatiellia bacterium]
MKMLDAIRRLRTSDMDFIETSDAAALLKVSAAHASKILARLADAEQLVPLKRGLWAFPDRLDPLQIPGAITAPVPSYISLQSALYRHGMISQIPFVVYAVSPARSRRWKTPISAISVHHIDPAFFFGYEPVGGKGVQMATPEKALLDIFYLSPVKSRLFQYLPELEWPSSFDAKRAMKMTDRIPCMRLRTIVRRRLDKALHADGHKES